MTSCNNLLQQAKMRSHGFRQLVTTSLLQVVNRFVSNCQQTCYKLIIVTCHQQACCKLFQQVVTSLQMTSCNNPDLNRLVATWWNWQACRNLLTSCNKPVKLTTCNNSVGFLAVYRQLATAFKYFLVDFTMQLVRQWQWNNVDETRLMHIWPHMNREWTHISSIFF